MSKIKVTNNSKLVLGFTLLCAVVLILNYATRGYTNKLLFSVYRAPLSSPFTYIRFFGHVLGHANFEHFIGNIMLIVVIGPMLEEKYGSKDLFTIIRRQVFFYALYSVFYTLPRPRFLLAVESISLIRFSWLTSLAPGS